MNIKKLIKRAELEVKCASDDIKYDVSHNPAIYSVVSASILTIGFFTGFIIGKITTKH